MPTPTTRMRSLSTILLLLTFFVPIADAVPIQLYGLNYNTRQGPDWDPFKCKNRQQVKVDLILLQKLTNRIRVLSVNDCGQEGELILDVAKELGMKIWLGLWVSQYEGIFSGELDSFQDMLNRGLIDDTVLGITVGSESIYREEVTVAENIEYKKQVKELCVAAGMPDLPVSIVDIAPTYEYNPQLLAAVDVVVTNSFPFWENIDIDKSTDYLLTEINPIRNQAAAQNKAVILGETGWPSDGFIAGVGSASPELQTEYFQRFFCRMDKELNWAYYYFTGLDNAWRQEQDPENTIEGNWGFFHANRTLKTHFQDLVFTCPGSSVEYTFSEIDWTLPTYMPTGPPVAPPTISPAPSSQASCQAHSGCETLQGDCCPTGTGLYLGCCGITAPPQSVSTAPPTTSPTKSPTAFPTSSPTAKVTIVPTTIAPGTAPPTSLPPTTTPTIVLPESSPPTIIAPITSPPTASPSAGESTTQPTLSPSTPKPTEEPTGEPTSRPTSEPSRLPTVDPTAANTSTPPTTFSPTTNSPEITPLPTSSPLPTASSPFEPETSNAVPAAARHRITVALVMCSLLVWF